MNLLNKNRSGLVFGALLGLFHAGWATLVAMGWAQGFINWIFGLHFIVPPYTIDAFNLGQALMLVVVTAVIGYVFGWVMAALWNSIHK